MATDVKLLRLLLITGIAVVVVKCRLDVNVALNRPSYQTSSYQGSYQFLLVPSYANDGNMDVNVELGPCAHTELETNPWWAVDLGVRLHVAGIQFTNRQEIDDTHLRSDDFIVGLTDVSPIVTPPTLWNYDFCGQWPGEVGNGATVYLKCACGLPPRRYVIIQFPHTDYSNFCEVKVYLRYWHYKATAGYKMINREADTFQVDRRLRCLITCTLSPICDSYNYSPADKTCQLNTHVTPLIANSADIVADSDWMWCSPVFVTVQ